MKIARITAYALELPLREPYMLSRGRRFEGFDSTFIRIDTDEGITGWGEVCPWGSTYLPAFTGGVRAAVAEIAPHLLSLDPRQPDVITRVMDRALTGHAYAKAGMDYAIWDIIGKAAGLPISELLGGAESEAIPLISSIHVASPEAMLDDVEYWRSLGYRRHSIKVGEDVDADIARVRFLAAKRQAGEVFGFDANGGWAPWEAVRVLNAVGGLDAWFEQPCLTYEECLSVRSQTTQALSLDECMMELRDVVRAINDRACEVINVKLARVGGITKARPIRDLCMAFDIPMMIMCMAGTVINDSAVAHFVSTLPANRCVGTWSCQEMVTVDSAPGRGARNANGSLTVPTGPGLGVEPDLDRLGEAIAVFR